MSPELKEALEWARGVYEQKPRKPLNERQERAVNLFGRVHPGKSTPKDQRKDVA